MARMAFDYAGERRPMPHPQGGQMVASYAEGYVELWKGPKGLYAVVYGLQMREGLTYEEAGKELGLCLMHSLACEGKLDR